MTTPESNPNPQPQAQPPAQGAHAFPPQPPPPTYAPPTAGGHQPPPGAPYPGQQAAPPYPGQPAGQPYPPAQPYAGQPSPYQYPAGQPGSPYGYGYPMAQPLRTPTGTLSWALGFLIFVMIPFVSSVISGVAMALTYSSGAKHGGVARENARSAANWGLTYVTLSVVLVITHFITAISLASTDLGDGFFPIGIPITIYFAISILHVVLVIMGTVKASRGTVLRVPFAIPYIRA